MADNPDAPAIRSNDSMTRSTRLCDHRYLLVPYINYNNMGTRTFQVLCVLWEFRALGSGKYYPKGDLQVQPHSEGN